MVFIGFRPRSCLVASIWFRQKNKTEWAESTATDWSKNWKTNHSKNSPLVSVLGWFDHVTVATTVSGTFLSSYPADSIVASNKSLVPKNGIPTTVGHELTHETSFAAGSPCPSSIYCCCHIYCCQVVCQESTLVDPNYPRNHPCQDHGWYWDKSELGKQPTSSSIGGGFVDMEQPSSYDINWLV